MPRAYLVSQIDIAHGVTHKICRMCICLRIWPLGGASTANLSRRVVQTLCLTLCWSC